MTKTELGRWEAGIAKVDITPPLGVWMAGFGNRVKGAQGMLDPLYATAVVIGNGTEKAALVTCDLLSIEASDADYVREIASEATGIPVAHILIHATHTHAGPHTSNMRAFGQRDEAYVSVLWRKIASSIQLAAQRMQQVRLTLGEGEAAIGVNRRHRLDGKTSIRDNPDGLVNRAVKTLGIWPLQEGAATPLGVVVWGATHPVMLGGSNYKISRDYPGFAVERIEKAFPGAVCCYINGPSADVNPLHMTTTQREYWTRRHGEVLAGGALAALASGEELQPGALVATSQLVQLPLEPLPSADEIKTEITARTEKIKASGQDVEVRLDIDYNITWGKDALKALESGPPADTLEVSLGAVALGDLVLIAMPFETFTKYQFDAAALIPDKKVLVLACTNGNYGYLPTEEAFAEGGYEIYDSARLYRLQVFKPRVSKAVLEGLDALLTPLQS